MELLNTDPTDARGCLVPESEIKTSCSFAIRKFFSRQSLVSCELVRLFGLYPSGFQKNSLGEVLCTLRGCPCSPGSLDGEFKVLVPP